MARKFRRNRSDGGSMLATMIIIAFAAILCSWIVLIAETEFRDWLILGIIVGSILSMCALLKYRYGGLQENSLAFWKSAFSNHSDDGLASSYRPQKLKNSHSKSGQSENRPASAEELRDIRESSANTWVPAGPAKPRN